MCSWWQPLQYGSSLKGTALFSVKSFLGCLARVTFRDLPLAVCVFLWVSELGSKQIHVVSSSTQGSEG